MASARREAVPWYANVSDSPVATITLFFHAAHGANGRSCRSFVSSARVTVTLVTPSASDAESRRQSCCVSRWGAALALAQ